MYLPVRILLKTPANIHKHLTQVVNCLYIIAEAWLLISVLRAAPPQYDTFESNLQATLTD